MDIFNRIADRKILEAIEDGILDNLSGNGRPLLFDDESWIPDDLRITYRILKSSGFVPFELQERKEIVNLRDLIRKLDDNSERLVRLRELNYRIMKLNMLRERPVSMDDECRIVERLMGADTTEKDE